MKARGPNANESKITGRCPAYSNALAVVDPMYPAPPVRRTFTDSNFRSVSTRRLDEGFLPDELSVGSPTP
jgi:hypothetical protein